MFALEGAFGGHPFWFSGFLDEETKFSIWKSSSLLKLRLQKWGGGQNPSSLGAHAPL